MALKRREAGPGAGGGGGGLAAGVFEKSHPTIAEFLSRDAWDGGTARTRGTALLLIEGGTAKVCLNDRDGGVVAFISAPDIATALVAAEIGLTDDTLDWRPSNAKARGKR